MTRRAMCGGLRGAARTVVVATLVLTVPSAANAQSDARLDCVIEPHAVIKIGSKVTGILKEVVVERGARVKRGQVLAKLEDGIETVDVEIARIRADAEAELEASKARLRNAEAKAKRVEELFARKVASAEARDEAITDRRIAELSVIETQMNRKLRAMELRRAEENLTRRTMRSPVNGVVHERLLSPGEFAHEQSPVMVLAELDPLNVEVFAPIALYKRIAVGDVVKVRPDEPVGGVYDAVVTVVDQVFDAASATFGVRLELANPDYALPAGLKCTAEFPNP